MQTIILASGSPRRKQLLESAGYRFEVQTPDESVEAAVPKTLSPRDYVIAAAFEKARAVSVDVEQGILLAADTVAECNGEILGKPKDRDDAQRILKKLSGTTHAVHTGVCLWHRPSNRHVEICETTQLEMDRLSNEWLTDYLDSELWRGKAGAFGFQDGLEWVRVADGLESNVVGLPIERLPNLFERLVNVADGV